MPLTLLLMFVGFALLIGLIVAVPIGLVLLIRHREAERSRPLQGLAAGLGLEFTERGGELPAGLGAAFPFAHGFSGRLFNRMSGRLAGTDVVFCDFATLTSQNSIVRRQTGSSQHQVAAFLLHDPAGVALAALARDARASAFHSDCASGWLVVSHSGFVPPQAFPGFLADAARVLALVAPDQGPAVERALASSS